MKIISKTTLEKIKKNKKVSLVSGEMDDKHYSDFICAYNPKHIFKANVYNVANGSGCPHCRYTLKITTESFNKALAKIRDDITMVGEYKGRRVRTEFMCNKHGHIFYTTPGSACNKDTSKGVRCHECVKEERKRKIWEKLNTIAQSNGYSIGEYIDNKTPIICHCNQKEEHIFSRTPRVIENGGGCNECKRISQIIPLWETHPKIAEMLKNPENGYIYSKGSVKKVEFICPVCGRTSHKKIGDVVSRGFSCPFCSDGISYPNKFMSEILHSLGISYEPEYSPKWISPKRYDFYFTYHGKKYIIEMDGIFHYREIVGSHSMIVSSDLEKDLIAQKHDIEVIRIDCDYKTTRARYEYIKNNILRSKLADILPLARVDFEKCDAISSAPSLKLVADIWNSGIKSTRGIQEKISHKTTLEGISKTLKTAALLKMISEDTEQVQKIIKEQGYIIASQKSRIKRARAVYSPELNKTFDYPGKAVSLYGRGVYKCLEGRQHYSGTTSDGIKITWQYV